MCFSAVRLGRCLALSFALVTALSWGHARAVSADDGLDQTRSTLESTLAKLPTLAIPEATETLLETYHALLDHPRASAEDRFAYFALVRALKSHDVLKDSGIDLQLSVLWSGAEIALREIEASKFGQRGQAGRAEFGIGYSLFLSSTAENTLDASAQYELMQLALEFLSVDLANDPHGNSFAEANAYLLTYLNGQSKSPPKSDRDRLIALKPARQAYQSALAALKSTELATAVIGTENPTLEYNRRVLRRNLDSAESDIQIASMEKLMNLSASAVDQQRVFQKLGDSSFSTCSAAYTALKSQPHFPESLIPTVLSVITSNSVPRSCRYAAILLTLKFDHLSMFEPLRQIWTEVIMSKSGIWYPEGEQMLKLPMELNFAINQVIFGNTGGEIPDLQSLCNSVLCVGDFALVESFWKSGYGPVSQVDDQGRIQMLAVPGKWFDRKHYFKSVATLNGLSVGALVMSKKASPQLRQLARQMLTCTGPEKYSADFYLQNLRGKIELMFESGFVLLQNTGILDRDWGDKIDDLEELK